MHPHTFLQEVQKFLGNFKWNKIKQDALDEIQHIVDRKTLLTYLDFNGEFKFTEMIEIFNQDQLSARKVNRLLSLEENLLMP